MIAFSFESKETRNSKETKCTITVSNGLDAISDWIKKLFQIFKKTEE